MLDLKTLNSAVGQLEEEKGVSSEDVIEAIETSLAAAYKKEYGRRGQIVRANFNRETGETEFSQVKIAVDESTVSLEDEESEDENAEEVSASEKQSSEDGQAKDAEAEDEEDSEEQRVRYNPEQHIFLEDARKIKKDIELDDEVVFALEEREDFGRIAAQTAKQVIIQKIREAERASVLEEYGQRQGEIVTGNVERIDRGALFVTLGKATGMMPPEERIPRERYRQGERIRAYLASVEESPRGVNLRLSRAAPEFVRELFRQEAPEIASETVEIRAVAREPGSRAKIAVLSHDEHVDPVGACVGQRGARVNTVMSELGGERIDIIEWSEDPAQFIADALSPAEAESVEIREDEGTALVVVDKEQLSLAIGRNGQNARLAAKLTGWRIDVQSRDGNIEEAYNALGEQEFAVNHDEDEEDETPGLAAEVEKAQEEAEEAGSSEAPEAEPESQTAETVEAESEEQTGAETDVASEESPEKEESTASQQENDPEEVEEEMVEEERAEEETPEQKEEFEEGSEETEDGEGEEKSAEKAAEEDKNNS